MRLFLSFAVLFLFCITLSDARLPAYAQDNVSALNRINGMWLAEDKKDVVLDVKVCGASLCGKIFWMNESLTKKAPHICGVTVLSEFERSGKDSNKWQNGTVYKASDNKYYKGIVEHESDHALKIRAYVGTPFLGRTVMFKRVKAEDYKPCTPQAKAVDAP